MKLIVSDYDNTLAFDHVINERDIKAINGFVDRKNIFAIATGRNALNMKTEAEKIGLKFNYIIGNNGAILMDNDGEIIYRFSIDETIIDEIIEDLKHQGVDVIFESDGLKYATTYTRPFSKISLHTFIQTKLKKKWKINQKEDLKDTIQISCGCDTFESAKRIAKVINEKYKSTIAYQNNNYIDIVPKKVNKVKGIKYIKAKHFIGNGQVYTVGDSYNDMEMIKNFQGYAVLNAIDEIKELSHEVVDGVFKVVERTDA